jgi:hypothetical protein
MITTFWLGITAVVFTAFGYRVGRRIETQHVIEAATDTCIESLLDAGYLKAELQDDQLELVKWDD